MDTMNLYSYTIMTMLRGPDYQSQIARELKQIFVTRFRSVVFSLPYCLGDYNALPLTLDDFCDIIRLFRVSPSESLHDWKELSHFIEHLYDAIGLHVSANVRLEFLELWSDEAVCKLHMILASPQGWDAQDYIHAFSAFTMRNGQVVVS